MFCKGMCVIYCNIRVFGKLFYLVGKEDYK